MRVKGKEVKPSTPKKPKKHSGSKATNNVDVVTGTLYKCNGDIPRACGLKLGFSEDTKVIKCVCGSTMTLIKEEPNSESSETDTPPGDAGA